MVGEFISGLRRLVFRQSSYIISTGGPEVVDIGLAFGGRTNGQAGSEASMQCIGKAMAMGKQSQSAVRVVSGQLLDFL